MQPRAASPKPMYRSHLRSDGLLTSDALASARRTGHIPPYPWRLTWPLTAGVAGGPVAPCAPFQRPGGMAGTNRTSAPSYRGCGPRSAACCIGATPFVHFDCLRSFSSRSAPVWNNEPPPRLAADDRRPDLSRTALGKKSRCATRGLCPRPSLSRKAQKMRATCAQPGKARGLTSLTCETVRAVKRESSPCIRDQTRRSAIRCLGVGLPGSAPRA